MKNVTFRSSGHFGKIFKKINDNPLNITSVVNDENTESVTQEERVEENAKLVLSQFENRCYAEMEQTLLYTNFRTTSFFGFNF